MCLAEGVPLFSRRPAQRHSDLQVTRQARKLAARLALADDCAAIGVNWDRGVFQLLASPIPHLFAGSGGAMTRGA